MQIRILNTLINRVLLLSVLTLSQGFFSLPLYADEQLVAKPVFAFTAGDPAALNVVSKYFTAGDYVSAGIAKKLPELGRRIGKSNQYKLAPSLSLLSKWANLPCADPNAPEIIIYDNEEWDATPKAEQLDVLGSINRGADIIAATGCRAYGLAPARIYLSGVSGCGAYPGELNHQIDWSRVNLLIIQSQGMLLNKCIAKFGYSKFVSFVAGVAGNAKKSNPKLVALAEVSLNRSPPEVILQAMNKTERFVDGFYIAYPQDGRECPYCTVEGLEKVLSQYRKATGKR